MSSTSPLVRVQTISSTQGGAWSCNRWRRDSMAAVNNALARASPARCNAGTETSPMKKRGPKTCCPRDFDTVNVRRCTWNNGMGSNDGAGDAKVRRCTSSIDTGKLTRVRYVQMKRAGPSGGSKDGGRACASSRLAGLRAIASRLVVWEYGWIRMDRDGEEAARTVGQDKMSIVFVRPQNQHQQPQIQNASHCAVSSITRPAKVRCVVQTRKLILNERSVQFGGGGVG